ncbi:hypothetical protein CY34DRAFT_148729 [Suillus luteus UH-Slu-Lm8-n1]|uniref:Uncharacterized protein n=1 Tax=Suillus luteus UH-Slu-Lm8-n1 TaxID=930992 RepID=A0A0D0BQH9_9AGAM|nr:hypothetical protein CY34DRAFT_148729 [Suillus luteus UH-Slu-Lm8-n1]
MRGLTPRCYLNLRAGLFDDIASPILVFFINESSALVRSIPGPATYTRALAFNRQSMTLVEKDTYWNNLS